MKTTLREEWDVYEGLVVPPNAGPNQRRQLRQAFMAGALTACNLHRRGVAFEDLKVEVLEIAERIIKEAKDQMEEQP